MNGTLISQPPGGGGSGSSVKNGGPACTKLIANDKPMAHMTQRSFAGLCVALDGTEYSNRSLINKNQPTTSGRLFDLVAANQTCSQTKARLRAEIFAESILSDVSRGYEPRFA